LIRYNHFFFLPLAGLIFFADLALVEFYLCLIIYYLFIF